MYTVVFDEGAKADYAIDVYHNADICALCPVDFLTILIQLSVTEGSRLFSPWLHL